VTFRTVVPDPAPRKVRRLLEPDERQAITVRKHPFQTVPGILPLVLVLVDYTLRTTRVVRGSADARHILLLLIAPCSVLAVYTIAAWWFSYVVFTTQRLFFPGWWPIRRMTQVPLAAADQVSFVRTASGRVWGYGTFRLKRPGSRWRMLKIRFLPYPEQLYLELCGMMFRDPSQEDYQFFDGD
jgi:hypothetical protein